VALRKDFALLRWQACNDAIDIVCDVNSIIIIRFCCVNTKKKDSLEIIIENAENAKTKISQHAIEAIHGKLLNVLKKESSNLPIFQCISFIFTELIDELSKKKKKEKKVKRAKIKNKAWWLTVGARIEYKHKGKKWKNGAIVKVSKAFKSTNVLIKYWH